jgi:GT2 family glycosyltransferase
VIPVMVLPTLTRHDLAARMLASIDCDVRMLIIINNYSHADFDAKPFIPATVKEHHVHHMASNIGVAASWNLGIKAQPFAPWWMVVSDDVVFAPGALQSFADAAGPDKLTISSEWPHYQFFGVGEQVISQVGLFDENLYPANFEDDDYQRRCGAAGVTIEQVAVSHSHVKQATVHAPEWAAQNSRTYGLNESYHRAKIERNDLTAGQWSLDIRRTNDWNDYGSP